MVCLCVIRLVSEHGEELKVEELSKGLTVLAKQVKDTSYRDVMKLLRLLLSGLQVGRHAAVQLMLVNALADRQMKQREKRVRCPLRTQ